jgi:hypothetical protein
MSPFPPMKMLLDTGEKIVGTLHGIPKRPVEK